MTQDHISNTIGRHRGDRPVRLLLLIVLLLFFSSSSYAAESGDVIREIEVQGLTRIRQSEFIDLVSFHVGETLDRGRLGDGIRRAFKTGVFRDIKAVSEPYKEGVRLIYRVTEIPVIKKISVIGNRAVKSRAIRKVFLFRVGEGFQNDLLDEAEDDLKRFYRERGFPDASVRLVVAAEGKSGVKIHVAVDEGNPKVIKGIHMPFGLSAYMNLSAGDILDKKKVEAGMKRVKDRLKKQHYIHPVVGPYEYSDGQLNVPVKPGPKLVRGFKQNNSVSTKELMKKLTFFEDEEVTDELIETSVDRIRALYRSKGFHHAEVAAAVSYGEELIHVDFIVFEGKKVYVGGIHFSGNTLSPVVLQSILPVKERKPFDSELLSVSRESLIRFYNALGYLNASLVDIREEYNDDGTKVDIEFVIDEGSQVVIREIDISGNRIIGSDVIRNVLRLHEGDPYNAIDIGDSRYRVQALYNRFGYLDAGIEVKSLIHDDKALLIFIITENKPSVAGKIIIRGNLKTKEKIIKREFTIEEGEPYSLEEITKIKRKLFRLGLFSEVSIDILEPVNNGGSSVDGGESLVRDMLVTLKESKAGAVEFGVGYGDYEKLRGSIDITYRNIGGYNRQIGLRAEKNAVWEKYILNYREPWLFNRPGLPFSAYLKQEKREAVNLDTKDLLYKIDKISFVAGVEMELSNNVKAGLNYEYSINDTSEVDPGVILSRDDSGTVGIGSISPSIFYDTRNDPFEPTTGTLTGIALKFASKLYFSETEFIKGTFQSSWYFLLRKGLVFAVSLKGGAAHAFGASEELPLIERFFLGGRTTVRGYRNDLLGPKSSDDVPTGGNVFALINSEFRFSIRKGFGIVMFIDGGNVWQLVHDIEPELKFTAGTGLRYRTPVGPLRIDYGYKMNRGKGESAGEFHFSFGHAF